MSENQKNLETRQCDVVVVGGGLAGLLAAIEARRNGADVVLFEPHQLGGRARSSTLADAIFNVGPHALYRDGEAWAALDRLGVEFNAPVPDGPQFVADERGEHMLPQGVTSLARTTALGARDKVDFARILTKLPKLDLADHADITVNEMIDGLTDRPRVAALLGAVVRIATYSADHDLISADAAVLQLQRALNGNVGYVDGGWGSLVDQLESVAREAGVIVEADEVSRVERRVAGGLDVVTASQRVTADAVVLAVSPAVVERLVDGVGVVDHAGPAVRASVLDVVVDHVPERRLILGIDRPTYVSVHSPPAALCGPGRSTVCAAKYLTADDESGHDDRRALMQAELERLGVSRSHIVDQRYSHALVVTAGMPMASAGGLTGRPQVDQGGGLFIAGDWVGGHGLLADASAASGCAAGMGAARAARIVAGV